MKILLIHTYYQIKGGEDVVFEQEKELLSQNNQVEELVFYNKKGLKGLLQFIFSIGNIFSSWKVKKKIKEFKPDIVHIHNFHFAASPIIIKTIKKYNIPLVVTLHNYRLLCPSAILLKNDQIFEDSLFVDFPWKAVKNKVYRNSYLQTFYLAFTTWVHKKIGTWNKVDKYFVLTPFAKELFLKSTIGIKEEKFLIKPNFIKNIENIENIENNENKSNLTPIVSNGVNGSINVNNEKKVIHSKNVLNKSKEKDEEFYLFVGRLSREKGLEIVLKAFKDSCYILHVAGEGPLRQELIEVTKQYKNIKYLGKLDKKEILYQMRQCKALLFPSIWYEGMPMTIIEAFSMSAIVIAGNLGAMKSMIIENVNGFLFESSNSEDLVRKIKKWEEIDEENKIRMRERVFNIFKEQYSYEKSQKILKEIYDSLCKRKD